METLKDYIDFDLKILSIGLNPSIISVKQEYYFANPRNRFWKALNASGLVSEELPPSRQSQQKLFQLYKIGFTDVVKRPSSMAKELIVADYQLWVPKLSQMIVNYRPEICWFHGKIAIKKFIQYSGLEKFEIKWGLQEFKVSESIIYVTPNPSPANAAYSLDTLIDWYQKLEALRCEISA
jgi:TDG/mug DNA glycosylase family protein